MGRLTKWHSLKPPGKCIAKSEHFAAFVQQLLHANNVDDIENRNGRSHVESANRCFECMTTKARRVSQLRIAGPIGYIRHRMKMQGSQVDFPGEGRPIRTGERRRGRVPVRVGLAAIPAGA